MQEQSQRIRIRDAVVLSGWSWDAWNVPERIAAALGYLGARVLYCENPVSRFRNRGRTFEKMSGHIHGFAPQFLGHRLNRLPFGSAVQAKLVCDQVLSKIDSYGLRDPIVIYPHGRFMLPVVSELKRSGLPVVHICMDYPEADQEAHIAFSDLTMVIPQLVYRDLHSRFGDLVVLLPQSAGFFSSEDASDSHLVPEDLARVPRPRLGYLGPSTGRLNLPLLSQLMKRNPSWQFVSFESRPCLPLANVHALQWRGRHCLKGIMAGLNVGFMPYDCSDLKNLHCAPLKLFDYFSVGLPVVSTPILFSDQYSDVIYRGSTADELAKSTADALREPLDSYNRDRRIEISRRHSIEHFAAALKMILAARFRGPSF